MKKVIISLIVLLSIILLVFLVLFSYYQSVESNLVKLDKRVINQWTLCFSLSTERCHMIEEYLNANKNEVSDYSGFQIILTDNLRKRNIYKNQCSIDFVELEHKLNEKMIHFSDKVNDNSTPRMITFMEAINKNNIILNDLTKGYNEYVLDYNQYLSTFPNFIIAKRNGLKRKEFFSIQYGIENEDPKIKSKKLPEWAIGVDTII
ncbi:MAG: LemA family protein [Paludibacter sp.]|nr:LemA family protein [Paludibacter sp.]